MNDSLKASQRQEARIAKRFSGRRTPGSGNTPFWKNDVRTDDTSFEMKYTGKKQYTLKASELEQGERHALLDGRYFVFGIEMNGRNWIVISEDDYASLRDGQVTEQEISEAITAHADHMEGYSLPTLGDGFGTGFSHAIRLLKRDAGFIASKLAHRGS